MNRTMSCQLIAVCCLLSVLLSCKRSSEGSTTGSTESKAKHRPNVTILKLEPRDVHYTMETVGSIEADEVQVHAQVAGIITKLNFREGDSVTAGKDTLAEIDPEQYALQRAQAEALKERAEALYRKSQDDHRKRVILFEKDVVTQDEVATFETAMKQAKADLDAASAALELARKNERESQVHSPISGLVQSRSVVLGQYMTSETLIATLLDFSTLRVRFTVPQSDVRHFALGQEITFSLKETPQEQYTAEIYYISQMADPQTRMVECRANRIHKREKVKSSPSDPPDKDALKLLKPGYFVMVHADLTVHEKAIVAPFEAIMPKEQGLVAYVLEDGKARERRVETGLYTPEGEVEILAGIHPGNTLILRGANIVMDGMEVNVVSEEKQNVK